VAVLVSALAFVAMLRFKVGMFAVLLGSALAGFVYYAAWA
jgi:hypothetical protein